MQNSMRMDEVIASGDRAQIQALYQEMSGEAPSGKWATKDLIKRLRALTPSETPPAAPAAPPPAPVPAAVAAPAPEPAAPSILPPLRTAPPSDQLTAEEIAQVQARTRADIEAGKHIPRVSDKGTGRKSKRVQHTAAPESVTPIPKREKGTGRKNTKMVLAQLKPGQVLTHKYRGTDVPDCKVTVITPPGEDGKGGKYRYGHKHYDSLREIIETDSGQSYNVLFFFGLAPWPKHKKKEATAEASAPAVSAASGG